MTSPCALDFPFDPTLFATSFFLSLVYARCVLSAATSESIRTRLLAIAIVIVITAIVVDFLGSPNCDPRRLGSEKHKESLRPMVDPHTRGFGAMRR